MNKNKLNGSRDSGGKRKFGALQVLKDGKEEVEDEEFR
jgi:hypothetical protein